MVSRGLFNLDRSHPVPRLSRHAANLLPSHRNGRMLRDRFHRCWPIFRTRLFPLGFLAFENETVCQSSYRYQLDLSPSAFFLTATETNMDQLKPEEKQIGKDNFDEAVGVTRREFLQGVVGAGAVSGAVLGAIVFRLRQESQRSCSRWCY